MFWRSKLFWFRRVAVKICLWGSYSWSSCVDGVTFTLLKKFKILLLKQTVRTASFTDVPLPAELYLLHWKMFWIPRSKLSNTWNLEALVSACLKNSAKTYFRHTILFYTSVRWLLKVNVLNRVFEMKDEMKLFSKLKANKFLSYISDKIWLKSLSYLAEIFEKLNNLNLKVQGKSTNIIQLRNESATILFEVAILVS